MRRISTPRSWDPSPRARSSFWCATWSAATAAQYVIDQNLAAVLNISFSYVRERRVDGNAAVNSMYQQAVSEGITITVSSDDAGVAGCTAQADIGTPNDVNSNGFAVNGLASTPYNLAVGGTDFNDLDPNTDSMYWSTTNQPGTFESALSHIPEMVWNDSCANPVFAQAYGTGDADRVLQYRDARDCSQHGRQSLH